MLKSWCGFFTLVAERLFVVFQQYAAAATLHYVTKRMQAPLLIETCFFSITGELLTQLFIQLQGFWKKKIVLKVNVLVQVFVQFS